MISPITKITLRDDYINDTHISVYVKISDKDDLVIDGGDCGKAPLEFWGDIDYEYITTIKKEYKDTVLLLLIKDRFKDSYDFRDWLKEKDIPNEYFTWV